MGPSLGAMRGQTPSPPPSPFYPTIELGFPQWWLRMGMEQYRFPSHGKGGGKLLGISWDSTAKCPRAEAEAVVGKERDAVTDRKADDYSVWKKSESLPHALMSCLRELEEGGRGTFKVGQG